MKSITCALLAAVVLGSPTSAQTPATTPPVPVTDAATVRITVPDGLGSGVSLGNGFIITAAHVVGDVKSVKVKSRAGTEVDGAVLWVSKAYDIALVRAEQSWQGAKLDCGVAHVGDQISAVGNPLGLDFITAYGRIAGDAREQGPWKLVYVTDMTTVMGQSGGPVFSAKGELIGITVGVISAPMKFKEDYIHSIVGFGFIVPSSVVCELMGGRV